MAEHGAIFGAMLQEFDGAARMRPTFGLSAIQGAPAFDPGSVPEPDFGAAEIVPSASEGNTGAALFTELHEASGRGQQPRDADGFGPAAVGSRTV